MIPIRVAGAAVALAVIAAVAPLSGSGDAADQVIEMPDGLKYTDTKLGDGAAGRRQQGLRPLHRVAVQGRRQGRQVRQLARPRPAL